LSNAFEKFNEGATEIKFHSTEYFHGGKIKIMKRNGIKTCGMLAMLVFPLLVECATTPKSIGLGLLGEPFTFIGIPKVLSETTFQDIDGLERGLIVNVVKVKTGTFNKPEIKFPIPADQPSPLKIGVTYLITAGYRPHDLVMLEYHEIH
jgi:hypothetical protein